MSLKRQWKITQRESKTTRDLSKTQKDLANRNQNFERSLILWVFEFIVCHCVSLGIIGSLQRQEAFSWCIESAGQRFPIVGAGLWKVSISSFSLTYYTQIDNRLYHKNDPTWLSACPLTVYALLHIAWGIRVAGPVWTYWAYPMERHCNTLLLSIKSRCHPYASINSFVTATAQLDQIWLLYDIYEALHLDPNKKEGSKLVHNLCTFGLSSGCSSSKFKKIHSICLLPPKVSCLEGGDLMTGHHFVKETKDSQDASFVQVQSFIYFYFFICAISEHSSVYSTCRSICSPP